MMSLVKLSSNFQIAIPRELREKLHLKSGQIFHVVEKDGIINLVPYKDIRQMRGFLKGMDISGIREEEDRI